MEESRGRYPHYVTIEFDVLNNEHLNSTEKILYGFITLLSDNSKNGCFAKTEYLCQLMQIKPRQLRRCIEHLKKLNYVQVEIKNNKRYIIPTVHKFIEEREIKNQQLFDYDWLNENGDENYL